MRARITNTQIADATGYFRRWCIAGGYAACPGLAGDCDVWVYQAENGQEERQHILDALKRLRVDFTKEDNDPEEETYLDPETGVMTWKVAKLGDGRHVLVTTATDIQQLLDAFDISTHQCALDSDGEFVRGRNWTPVNVPPVLLRQGKNAQERMERISSRYHHFYRDWPEQNFRGSF